jgi:Tol biopolymer transport system component
MTKLCCAILAIVLTGALSAEAYHRKTPALLQITPGAAVTVGNARWGGFRYVFLDSDADLVGNGSTGRQIFFFDLQERDKTGLLAIHQLTFDGGDNRRPSAGTHAKVVAYDAALNGGPRQVMLVHRLGGPPWALTQGAADSVNAHLDDGGRYVAFESQADLLGSGLGGTQVYVADLRVADAACPFPCAATGNAGLSQITHKSGTNRNAVVSKAGKVIAFESDADLLDTGETETQVYLFDTTTALLRRPSHGPGASRNPTLSKKANLLAFESDADLLANGSTGTQIFLLKRIDNILQQITAAPGAQSTSPSMETSGRGILFESNADLLANGSVGRQLFEYNVTTGVIRQVTETSGTIRDPAYSAGVFTVFLSDGDLLGNGSSGEQLYLVNLFALSGSLP